MTNGNSVHLDFHSTYEMLDFVQVASDHLGRLAGLDDEALHWLGVAVRESVINAIKHGNREVYDKLVTVEFSLTPVGQPTELIVRVLDQGQGFDPEHVANREAQGSPAAEHFIAVEVINVGKAAANFHLTIDV